MQKKNEVKKAYKVPVSGYCPLIAVYSGHVTSYRGAVSGYAPLTGKQGMEI